MDVLITALEAIFGKGDSDHAWWLAAVRLDILLFVACGTAVVVWIAAGRHFDRRRWSDADIAIVVILTALGGLLRVLAQANIADFGGIGYSRILFGYKGHFGAAQLYSLIYQQTARDLEHAIALNRIAAAVSVPLVYALCRRLLPESRAFAVCSAALLALHPLHIIFSATDGLGSSSTLIAAASYLLLSIAIDGGDAPRWLRRIAAVAGGAGLALVTQVRYENLLLLAPPGFYVLARWRDAFRPVLPGVLVGALFLALFGAATIGSGSSFQNPILLEDIVRGLRDELLGNPIFAMLPVLVGVAAALLYRRSRIRLFALLPVLAVLPLAAVVSPDGHHLARTYLNLLLPLTLVAGYGLALLWGSPRPAVRALTVACLLWATVLPFYHRGNLRERHLEMAEHVFLRDALAALPENVDRVIVPDDERLFRQTGSTNETMVKYRSIANSARPDVDVVGTSRFFEQPDQVDCSRDNCAFFHGVPCMGLKRYWFAADECARIAPALGEPLAEEEVIAGSFVDCSVYAGQAWRERCAPARLARRFGLFRIAP